MFFAGLAQGFSQAQEQDRALQAQIDEQSAQREQATLLHLATTHPDPGVRASAMGAMLTPRQPTGGFMGRMFNAAKTNPAMPSLMALMESQKSVPVMGQQQTEPGPTTMQEPGAGTLAGAATPPPGELGIPQASMAQTHNLLAQGPPESRTVQTGTRMVSRGAPPTGAQVAGQTTYEQLAGQFRAFDDVGGSTDPQMKQLMLNRKMGIPERYVTNNDGSVDLVSGNLTLHTSAQGKTSAPEAQIQSQVRDYMAKNPDATWHDADTAVRSGQASKTAAQVSTAVSGAGTAASRATITGVEAANAPAMAATRLQKMRQEILDDQTAQKGTLLSNELKQRTLNGQLTEVEAYRVLSPLWQRPGVTSDIFNEYLDSVTSGGKVSGGTGATPAATAPPGQEAPAAGPPASAATPPAAAPPPAAAGSPPPAAPTTRPTPRRGGLPPGQTLYKPNAQEQSTLDVIAGARPMMQQIRSLIGNNVDDSLVGQLKGKANAIGQTVQTELGLSPSDPVYKALDPLINHLKVFSVSPYLHGIRNGQFVTPVMENTPNDTDTFARIRDKLDNLDKTFKSIEDAIGVGKPAASQPPPGGAKGGTVGMRDPAGNHLDVPAGHVDYVKSLGGTLE